LKSAPQSKIAKKNAKTPNVGSSRSFKVITVDTFKKLVTSDKQHVCAYLQPFSRYTSQ